MKICIIIPFYYKWNNSANIKCHYDYLKNIYDVDLFSKKELDGVDLNNYDLIMLHGSGAFLPNELYKSCNKPIFGFGWSDPNLFNEIHYEQSHIYFTNDLNTYNKLEYFDKKVYYYQTACNKEFHKNLELDKITDVLVFGCGNHKFVTNRNEVVNKLRQKGFHIKVFGRGWDEHKDTHGFIEGKEFIKEINQAKIVLDIINETSSWTHRIFEASACGTPVITYDREDTKQLLKVGKEVFLYKNLEDIIDKLDTWLSYPGILKDVGKLAQQRCYRDHDISVRIQELLKIIKENGL